MIREITVLEDCTGRAISGLAGKSFAPVLPIDWRFGDFYDFDLIGRNPIREQDQVQACPSRARRYQAVKAQEERRIGNLLGPPVITACLAGDVDT
jgi:hypothetical protein